MGQDVDELTVELLDHKVAFVGEEEKFYALANYSSGTPRDAELFFQIIEIKLTI